MSRVAPPLWRAMPRCWCTSAVTACARRALPTCFRTRRTSSRSPFSSGCSATTLIAAGRDYRKGSGIGHKKRAAEAAPDGAADSSSVALPGKRHEQIQQTDKNIIQVQKQVQCCHDVVGLATANNRAHVVEQVKREDQDGDSRNSHRDCGHLEEQVCQRRDDKQDQTDKKKLAQEAKV